MKMANERTQGLCMHPDHGWQVSTCSHSVNTIASIQDGILSDDLFAGQRINGRMSRVRRSFCLFVAFDLLITAVMWLISITLTGKNIEDQLITHIYHYTIHGSMFDVVVVSLCRFVLLLVFYACCYLNHWFIVSLTTTATCSFLIAKIVIYNWPQSAQPVFEVLLILASFILCWGEVWFLDIKVLPQETTSRRFLLGSVSQERAPLVQNYVNSLPSATYCESVGAFHSIRNSPDGSISSFSKAALAIKREMEYKQLSGETLQEAWELMHATDWQLKKQTDSTGVYTMKNVTHGGTLYKLTTSMEAPADLICQVLFDNVITMTTWTATILEVRRLDEIDKCTDIIYQVSASGAGGVVSSRDFVVLRHRRCQDGAYVIASVSVEHPDVPPSESCVRGHCGPSCWVMEPYATDDATKSRLHWVLNTNLNLKTFIPQLLQEKAFIVTMLKFIQEFRQHLDDIQHRSVLV